MVGFVDAKTLETVTTAYSGELAAAVKSAALPGTSPEKFGAKCDVLAIHADGHLEAIEVKPENVATLAWVPAQATMYARILTYWIENDPEWDQAITRMFEQRQRLRLTPEGFRLPTLQPKVVPAVAFPRTASGKYVDRMFKLQRHLRTTPVGDRSLVFYRASLSGRLDHVTRP